MDALALLRMTGALGVVLGLLAGGLWLVRRFDITLPGQIGAGRRRRLELVERLSLDAKRSIALIRRDGQEHLILIGPEGHGIIETAIPPESPQSFADHLPGVPAMPELYRPPVIVPRADPVPTPAPVPATSPAPEPAGFGGWIDRERAALRRKTVASMRPMPRPRSTGVAERAARRVAAGA